MIKPYTKLVPFVFILFLSLSSCKKTLEKIGEDLVVKAMTDGQWKITNFVHNGSDITTEYASYRFKYYSNRTVDAIKNGVVEKTGTWGGNASNMTTWADFVGANHPLNLINGTWHIDNNSWTFVVASQANAGETRAMRLDKE